MIKNLDIRKGISLGIVFAFLVNAFGPICPIACSADGEFILPAPGLMIHLSPAFNPSILKGIKVHPDNPFRFDFILDRGDSNTVIPAQAGIQNQEQLKQQATKLIKYFLASLTIPEKDLWVNLSPYEKDRIIPNNFGLTEMGRDLLAEDYMLKQITASLIYPEDEAGKRFWKRIYEEAAKKFGTTNIPVNTFNKIWIVPEKAVVYENAKAGTAYVVESKLKVMLEQDYLSMSKHADVGVAERGASPSTRNEVRTDGETRGQDPDINRLGSQIIREIVIPELTREVNEGKNFAQLRQVYNSLILATWYKKKIKDSILEQVYVNKNKVTGVNIGDSQEKEKIYQQYLQAFKKGVFNYIKDEQDLLTHQVIPRKYFSGGESFTRMEMQQAMHIVQSLPGDAAMTTAADSVVEADITPLPSGPLAGEYVGTVQGIISDSIKEFPETSFQNDEEKMHYIRGLMVFAYKYLFNQAGDLWSFEGLHKQYLDFIKVITFLKPALAAIAVNAASLPSVQRAVLDELWAMLGEFHRYEAVARHRMESLSCFQANGLLASSIRELITARNFYGALTVYDIDEISKMSSDSEKNWTLLQDIVRHPETSPEVALAAAGLLKQWFLSNIKTLKDSPDITIFLKKIVGILSAPNTSPDVRRTSLTALTEALSTLPKDGVQHQYRERLIMERLVLIESVLFEIMKIPANSYHFMDSDLQDVLGSSRFIHQYHRQLNPNFLQDLYRLAQDPLKLSKTQGVRMVLGTDLFLDAWYKKNQARPSTDSKDTHNLMPVAITPEVRYAWLQETVVGPLKEALAREGRFKGWEDDSDLPNMDARISGLKIGDVVTIINEIYTVDEIGDLLEKGASYSSLNPDMDYNVRLLAPYWAPYFAQIIHASGLGADEFIRRLSRKELPLYIIDQLRAPWKREGEASCGFSKYEVAPSLFENYLRERLSGVVANGKPRSLKILLGGTLPGEMTTVAQEVENALKDVAARNHVQDVESWIESWDIRIVAYSIETAHLLDLGRAMRRQENKRYQRWIKVEYIDLLDDFQVDRMRAEKPDIVLTVDSLYLGQYFSKAADRVTPEKTARYLHYAKNIFDMLSLGGLFIVEISPSVDPPFEGFMKVGPPRQFPFRSGFFVKAEPSSYPLAFLGSEEDSSYENMLYEAGRFFDSGEFTNAAVKVFAAFSKNVRDTAGRPLRFSRETVSMILDSYLAQGADQTPFRKQMEFLKQHLADTMLSDVNQLPGRQQIEEIADAVHPVEPDRAMNSDQRRIKIYGLDGVQQETIRNFISSDRDLQGMLKAIPQDQEILIIGGGEKVQVRPIEGSLKTDFENVFERELKGFVISLNERWEHSPVEQKLGAIQHEFSHIALQIEWAKNGGEKLAAIRHLANWVYNGRPELMQDLYQHCYDFVTTKFQLEHGWAQAAENYRKRILVLNEDFTQEERVFNRIAAYSFLYIPAHLALEQHEPLRAPSLREELGRPLMIPVDHLKKMDDIIDTLILPRLIDETWLEPVTFLRMYNEFLRAIYQNFGHLEVAGHHQSTGGIDFTANKTPLEIQHEGQGIKFHLDPAMLELLQNAPGFVPVIVSIHPMTDLKAFLFNYS